jgi:glutathione-regulated potassium-efflux system ancillary protein KefC
LVDLYNSAIIASSIIIAGIISSRVKISSIVEVVMGIVLANILLLKIEGWLDFLATFGGLILTFLAGVEVESRLLRKRFKESALIGTLAFVAPLVGEMVFLTLFTDWQFSTKLASSLALTTTSVAVVYAVLAEYNTYRVCKDYNSNNVC